MQNPTPQMPLGFALSLALHPSAMQNYAAMDSVAQLEYLNRAANATSRTQMNELIKELEDKKE